MTHLIDKSALVAKIERRIRVLQDHPMENHKTICHLDSLKQSLDTLEVKEIDDKPDCMIFPRPVECYSTCKGCPYSVTNNKAQKGE